jgi:eukaryotic-like serine/threonine-protein kinase
VTPERWSEIQRQLDVALSLTTVERQAFLESIGANDLDLRREIESLLTGEAAVPDFLNTPALGLLQTSSPDSVSSRFSITGQVVGAYRVTDLLGAGGMGEVYRGVRADGVYDQHVAVKIVRPGAGGEFSSVRFRNERQILAKLDHPNIATILDGGTTEGGLSYFVMELIDGVPITEYCDQNRLSIEERFRLFRTVCSAVHYAHQHLVVHRDIKPTNILVTPQGVPKLLDFGIAKMLSPDSPVENATLTGVWAMTPEYASPEQLRGDPITTATDIYSLGLILYELLTGQRAHQFSSRMPHEMARVVLESDPRKPSSAIFRKTQSSGSHNDSAENRDAGSAPDTTSALRGFSSARKLQRRLVGDPDNIVLKALRKEPAGRYASSDQLSEDIRRHLEGRPITASKGTTAYRVRKYVFRHKAGVAGAAIVFLTLVIGMLVNLREARIAQRNELRAEKRFNDVRKLANSLLFEIHDSVRNLPGSTPARKLIVGNALQYLDSLSSEAAGDTSLQRELATAYERVGEVQGDFTFFNLGETENSLRNYQKALELRKSVAGSKSATWEDQLALAKSYRLVAAQLRVTGNLAAALQNAQEAVSICERLRDAHPEDKKVLAELRTAYDRIGHIQRGSWSQAYSGDTPAALESFRKAMETNAVLLKLDPESEESQLQAAEEEMFYAQALPTSRNAERLPHYQHALDIEKKLNERSPSPVHAEGVAGVLNRIAMWYDGQRDHIKSAEYHRHYVDIVESLYAADPLNAALKLEVVIGDGNLGEELGRLGQQKESARLLDRAVTLMRSIAQASPQNTSQQGLLGAVLGMRGDNFLRWKNVKSGLDDYAAAIDIYARLLAANPNNTTAHIRLLICRMAVAHTKLQAGVPRSAVELEAALKDLNPLLSDPGVNDEPLYAAAAGYADLGKLEISAARNAVATAKKPHWEAAAHWYGLSLSALKRVQNLPSQSESEAFGPLDPAGISKQLAICESALSPSKLAAR